MFQGMEYVYAVYKEKSFSQAAKKLFISQPSLSASVKREEQSVGYPIFDRSTKPLGLTEPGKRYIETVEQILAMQNNFTEYMNDWGNLKTGNLVLGGSSLYSSWVLPRLMGAFTRKYPQVSLELVEESTAKLTRLLQSGEIDLMVDNKELDPGMFERQLYRREYLLLAVPGHMEINRKLESYQLPVESIRNLSFLEEQVPAVNLGYFAEEPFILLKPANDTRTRSMELCREYGFVPKMIFELDQQMTSYNITCSGLGISFISDTLVARMPVVSDVVFYKLNLDKSRRNVYFYWKKGRYLNRIMEEFLKEAGTWQSGREPDV